MLSGVNKHGKNGGNLCALQCAGWSAILKCVSSCCISDCELFEGFFQPLALVGTLLHFPYFHPVTKKKEAVQLQWYYSVREALQM